MDYEIGVRLDVLEVSVLELQKKIFPERFEKKNEKK